MVVSRRVSRGEPHLRSGVVRARYRLGAARWHAAPSRAGSGRDSARSGPRPHGRRASQIATRTPVARTMARLLSVNVGLPRDIEWKGRTVHTGIWKQPISGHCRAGRLNLDGDGQGDLAGHGGEQRAVFVYQIESYRYWQAQLRRFDFVHGQFGENFTVEGLPDDEVCIGDRFQIGSALFEVTQPRVTCYRV